MMGGGRNPPPPPVQSTLQKPGINRVKRRLELLDLNYEQEAEAAWKLTTIKKNCETAFI